jgi:hypothetical protein
MSLKALAWTMEQTENLSAVEKSVLWVLANSHNEITGRCNPGLTRIAKYACCADRTAMRAISSLEAQGRIVVVRETREDGTNKPNEYTLVMNGGDKLSGGYGQSDGVGTVRESPETVRTESVEETASSAIASSSSKKTADSEGKRITTVDDEFVSRMVDRFGKALGGRLGINERIGEAKAHASWGKYTDKQAYITGWLRRDAERAPFSRNTRPVPSTNPEDFAEF